MCVCEKQKKPSQSSSIFLPNLSQKRSRFASNGSISCLPIDSKIAQLSSSRRRYLCATTCTNHRTQPSRNRCQITAIVKDWPPSCVHAFEFIAHDCTCTRIVRHAFDVAQRVSESEHMANSMGPTVVVFWRRLRLHDSKQKAKTCISDVRQIHLNTESNFIVIPTNRKDYTHTNIHTQPHSHSHT